MKITDVTGLVSVAFGDEEFLPITKCLCGATWEWWTAPNISHLKDIGELLKCPECGRKYFFTMATRVYAVTE